MAGTKLGATKLIRTNIATYGSMEAYKQFMRDIGSKGGRNGHTGGFAGRPDLAAAAGRLAKGVRKKPRTAKASSPDTPQGI